MDGSNMKKVIYENPGWIFFLFWKDWNTFKTLQIICILLCIKNQHVISFIIFVVMLKLHNTLCDEAGHSLNQLPMVVTPKGSFLGQLSAGVSSLESSSSHRIWRTQHAPPAALGQVMARSSPYIGFLVRENVLRMFRITQLLGLK